MYKKLITNILCGLILFGGLLTTLSVVQADDSVGGEVSRTSKITFYEGDETLPPKPVPPKPSILPQTGENKNDYVFLGMTILIFTGMLVTVRKRQVARP